MSLLPDRCPPFELSAAIARATNRSSTAKAALGATKWLDPAPANWRYPLLALQWRIALLPAGWTFTVELRDGKATRIVNLRASSRSWSGLAPRAPGDPHGGRA